MDRGAWWATVHGVAESPHDRTIATFTFACPLETGLLLVPDCTSYPRAHTRYELRWSTSHDAPCQQPQRQRGCRWAPCLLHQGQGHAVRECWLSLRREWRPTPLLLPREFQGLSLAGYMHEAASRTRLTHTHTHCYQRINTKQHR